MDDGPGDHGAVGSFAETILPGVRLGWAAEPPEVIAQLAVAKQNSDQSVGRGGAVTDSETYFSTEAGGVPTGPGRFVTVNEIDAVAFVPGLEFRPVVGDNVMTNFVTFAPHTVAPTHVHEEEQVVIVLDGELEFVIDGQTRLLRPGDVAVIPSWVPHGARTLDVGCTELDVFTPPRRALLDLARAPRERRD